MRDDKCLAWQKMRTSRQLQWRQQLRSEGGKLYRYIASEQRCQVIGGTGYNHGRYIGAREVGRKQEAGGTSAQSASPLTPQGKYGDQHEQQL